MNELFSREGEERGLFVLGSREVSQGTVERRIQMNGCWETLRLIMRWELSCFGGIGGCF